MSDVKPLGRPQKYKDEYCQQLIDHMAKGYSYESFAGVLSVSKQTLYNWEKEHQIFLDAKEIGIEKSRCFWEALGIDYIINESTHGVGSKSLNGTVWRMNMINRFKWKDKVEQATTLKIEGLENMSDDELLTKITELLGKEKLIEQIQKMETDNDDLQV